MAGELDFLRHYYATDGVDRRSYGPGGHVRPQEPVAGASEWFDELPRAQQFHDLEGMPTSPWLPVRPDPDVRGFTYLPEELMLQMQNEKQQEPQQGRLPTSEERAGGNPLKTWWFDQGDKMRNEVERRKTQPWWGDDFRPAPGSVAAEWSANGLGALSGVRGGYGIYHGMPDPLTLPGMPNGHGQQPLHFDGGIPRSVLAPLGAYAGKTRPYEGDLPPTTLPEPRLRIPGPIDENGREVIFPEGQPHVPSILSMIAPQWLREHIDLDHIAEHPGYHARHIADPLIATWGLGAPGAEGVAALNALSRALGRISPGLGTSKVEALSSAPARYGTGRYQP